MNERQLTIIYKMLDEECVKMLLRSVTTAGDDEQYLEARADMKEIKEIRDLVDEMIDESVDVRLINETNIEDSWFV